MESRRKRGRDTAAHILQPDANNQLQEVPLNEPAQ